MTNPHPPQQDVSGYFISRRYAWYALGILTLVQMFSIVDRQIVTILAGEIKRDFALSDAEMGLIYGTLFAVFYALFGIPLGRLSDNWIRKRVVGLGLIGWSFMGMLSGLAANTWQFALTRVGVGIGEASAGPAATSLISDYFPDRLRATALAIFSCGVALGVGASLWLGGSMVDIWAALHPDGNYTFGLRGWQVSFIVVAIPGFVLSLFVLSLKEPPRAATFDGMEKQPFTACWLEMKAILPGISLLSMLLDRTPKKTIGVNLLVLAVLGFATVQMVQFCYGLVEPASITTIFHLAGIPVTSHTVQWSIVALGLYCVFTWSQTFKLRDPASHTLICRTPSSVLVIVAGSAAMTISYGVMGWAPHFAVITYEQSLASIGMKFGITATIVGIGGTLLGGYLGDRLNRTNPCGRLYVTLGAIVLMVPAALFTFTRPTLGSFLTGFAILSLASTAWLPGVLSTLQELVLPRMRGLIYATYYLVVTIIGLGTGPYVAGLISDVTGDLRTGILSLYFAAPVVWLCLGVAIYRLQKDIDSRFARARDAGEVTAADPAASIA